MIDYTDRHCRYLMRLLCKRARLYTEMMTTQALIHGDAKRYLKYHAAEHPLALQLGDNNAKRLAYCSQLAEQLGYDEINLNVGCPSDRVQSGEFGACLMKTPQLVADCIAAMQAQVKIPVTVKCRTGIDRNHHYDYLYQFIDTVQQTGCQTFIIHARNAWLKGLSPKQNRSIPPLNYDYVYRLKHDFPHLTIIINGGINQLTDIKQHLKQVDGVMLGRAAYHNLFLLAHMDSELYGETDTLASRKIVLERFLPYIADGS